VTGKAGAAMIAGLVRGLVDQAPLLGVAVAATVVVIRRIKRGRKT
jgi:hypothetical protein